MQTQGEGKAVLGWRPADKALELEFWWGEPLASDHEDSQEKKEAGSSRKSGGSSESSGGSEPSSQLVDFERGEGNQPLEVSSSGWLVVDEVAHSCVFVTRGAVPNITVGSVG
jgi:hypothetical protein